MLTNAVLDITIKGLGKNGVTSIFPCGIFQYMEGVNDKPGTPNYDLKRKALESCAKRIYPNFANVSWSVNTGYDPNDPRTYMSTMGKRNTTAHLKSGEPSLMQLDICISGLWGMNLAA